MSRHGYECPGCGEHVPSLWGSIIHCPPYEPIDDLDNPDIIPGSD